MNERFSGPPLMVLLGGVPAHAPVSLDPELDRLRLFLRERRLQNAARMASRSFFRVARNDDDLHTNGMFPRPDPDPHDQREVGQVFDVGPCTNLPCNGAGPSTGISPPAGRSVASFSVVW